MTVYPLLLTFLSTKCFKSTLSNMWKFQEKSLREKKQRKKGVGDGRMKEGIGEGSGGYLKRKRKKKMKTEKNEM